MTDDRGRCPDLRLSFTGPCDSGSVNQNSIQADWLPPYPAALYPPENSDSAVDESAPSDKSVQPAVSFSHKRG